MRIIQLDLQNFRVTSTLADEVEHAHELIMNPLSHARIISVYPAEVQESN